MVVGDELHIFQEQRGRESKGLLFLLTHKQDPSLPHSDLGQRDPSDGDNEIPLASHYKTDGKECFRYRLVEVPHQVEYWIIILLVQKTFRLR